MVNQGQATNTLAARIQAAVRKKGYPTPQHAALALKISPVGFSQVLKGRSSPNSRTYPAYAKLLDVSIEEVEQLARLHDIQSHEPSADDLQHAIKVIQHVGLARILPRYQSADILVLRSLNDHQVREVIQFARRLAQTIHTDAPLATLPAPKARKSDTKRRTRTQATPGAKKPQGKTATSHETKKANAIRPVTQKG